MLGVILLVGIGTIGVLIGLAMGGNRAGYWNEGEALVANALSQLSIPHHLINNVTLPLENGTTQIPTFCSSGNAWEKADRILGAEIPTEAQRH